MAGEVIENQTIAHDVPNAEGNTYINCVFEGTLLGTTSIHGDGITFVNCTFDSDCFPSRRINILGEGHVVSGGTVKQCTTFGPAAVIGKDVSWSGTAGADSNIQGDGVFAWSKPVVTTSKGCCSKITGEGKDDVVEKERCRIQCTTDESKNVTGNRVTGPDKKDEEGEGGDTPAP